MEHRLQGSFQETVRKIAGNPQWVMAWVVFGICDHLFFGTVVERLYVVAPGVTARMVPALTWLFGSPLSIAATIAVIVLALVFGNEYRTWRKERALTRASSSLSALQRLYWVLLSTLLAAWIGGEIVRLTGFWTRAFLVFVFCGIVGATCDALIARASVAPTKEHTPPEPPRTVLTQLNGQPNPPSPTIEAPNNSGIVTNNQNGNNTIVEQQSKPEIRIVSEKETPNPDGTYSFKIGVQVVAEITPGKLTLQVIADGLLETNVMPQPIGGISASMQTNVLRYRGGFMTTIPSPSGVYYIEGKIAQKTQIKVGYQF
jgi:hypothetical protein